MPLPSKEHFDYEAVNEDELDREDDENERDDDDEEEEEDDDEEEEEEEEAKTFKFHESFT